MMQVKLIRDIYDSFATQGRLFVGNEVFYTLEEPWKLNKKGISCIPKGTYKVTPHNWAGHPRFRFNRVWHINDVPNRSSILIHTGNTTADIEGCILVGMSRGAIGKKTAVLNSRLAMSKLRDIIGQNDFTLTIED
jgi:hypothetical protein